MSHCAGNLTAALEGSLHVALHSSHCPVTYNAPVTDGTGGKFIIMEDKQQKNNPQNDGPKHSNLLGY